MKKLALVLALLLILILNTASAQIENLEVHTFESIEKAQAWMATNTQTVATYRIQAAFQKSVKQGLWKDGDVRLHLIKQSKSSFFISVKSIIERNPYTGTTPEGYTGTGAFAATGDLAKMRQIRTNQQLSEEQIRKLNEIAPGVRVENLADGAMIMYPAPEYKKVMELLKEFNLWLKTTNESFSHLLKSNDESITKLIDALLQKGTTEDGRFWEIFEMYQQQTFLLWQQQAELIQLARTPRYGIKVEKVIGDVAYGNIIHYHGPVINIGNGAPGSGSHFTGVSECWLEPVDFPY